MERVIIKTADGSDSLYVKDLNEHYHSIHGAVQESEHVFIDAGLKYISARNKNISVLEIGFGTGLNAYLTFIESSKLDLIINYSALETFPLEMDLIEKLNYAECLNEEKDILKTIHACDWEKEIAVSNFFILHKIKNSLQEIILSDSYDLIYFDAFGPNVQPEMWTEELFSKLFSALKPEGVLVTYCAKGEVKRILKRVGFDVESLKGPPGKREMVRANKK